MIKLHLAPRTRRPSGSRCCAHGSVHHLAKATVRRRRSRYSGSGCRMRQSIRTKEEARQRYESIWSNLGARAIEELIELTL